MASYTENAVTGGDWNTPADWTPNAVPGADDNALFATGGNSYAVTGDASVGGITVDADQVTFAGALTICGGSFSGTDDAYVVIGAERHGGRGAGHRPPRGLIRRRAAQRLCNRAGTTRLEHDGQGRHCAPSRSRNNVATANCRESDRAQASTSLQTLVEMAVCPAPPTGRRRCTDIDLRTPGAEVATLFEVASLYDAIQYDLADGPLIIRPE